MSARPATSEDRRAAITCVALLAVAAAIVAGVQRGLALAERRVKEREDVYVLPPPADVVRMSLGYRSAVADLIWAHVLVSQGLHTLEKRRFENLIGLMHTISELDPQFRDPYLFADALITIQVGETSHEELVAARAIMERGVKERPLDAELWLVLGQFVSFVAPSFLEDPDEQQRWRREGAVYLARAAELAGEESWIGWQALGGASILGRGGDRAAQIRFYERVIAVTDDEELKADAQQKLERLLGDEAMEAYRARERDMAAIRRRDLPFVSRTRLTVLGPPPDPWRCAGAGHDDDPACALTWRDWATRRGRAPRGE